MHALRDIVERQRTGCHCLIGDATGDTSYRAAMAKQKKSRHRGVRFVPLKTGMVVRWTDPITGKVTQRSCRELGLTNAKKRELWAIGKLEALRKQKGELEKVHGTDSPTPRPLQDAVDEYLAGFAKKNTVESKRPALRAFVEYMAGEGVKKTTDITAVWLARFSKHLERTTALKVTTRNLHRSTVKAFLSDCSDLGYLGALPDGAIGKRLRSEAEPDARPEVLTPSELRTLLRACIEHDRHEKNRIAPFVLFLVLTGCRPTEALKLDWSAVDLDAGKIRLEATAVKTSKYRDITLKESPAVVDLLSALRLKGTRERVFDLSHDRATKARERVAERYDGPPGWTFRKLRRTCGSVLVCADILPVFLTAKRLGNTVLVAEKHYLGTLDGLPRVETIEEATGIAPEVDEILAALTTQPSRE